MGALQIPIGTFHRSISGQNGSIVINQAIRDEKFEANTEFNPVSIKKRKDLEKAKSIDPIIWLIKIKIYMALKSSSRYKNKFDCVSTTTSI
tara:strand:- start:76 stop:348 length:273 start_codon:yes stop_codon:yes gene_type:complete